MEQDWINALVGGILIGFAAALMLFFNGRVMGASGIFNGIFRFTKNDTAWRVSFLLGILGGGGVILLLQPEAFRIPEYDISRLIAAGLIVGFGTAMGGGCTSGHGICGITRLSLRSIIATCTFLGFGILSVYLFKFVFGVY